MRRKHFIVVAVIAYFITVLLGLLQQATGISLSAFYLLLRAAIVPASVRRIHDMGYSGWFALGVFFIPAATLLLLFIPPDAGTEFGPDPRITPVTNESTGPKDPTNSTSA